MIISDYYGKGSYFESYETCKKENHKKNKIQSVDNPYIFIKI